MRLIISILMIAAIIAGFALFIVPHYGNVQALRAQAADYNQILDNAKALQKERNRLVEKYNAFDQGQLAKLDTLLPTNPENVQLILELDAVAAQYGLVLQNVKVDAQDAQIAARPGQPVANAEIGTLPITFSVTGGYNGFTNFLRAIEQSLRVIDPVKLTFTALDDRQTYQYTVGVKTYWLK